MYFPPFIHNKCGYCINPDPIQFIPISILVLNLVRHGCGRIGFNDHQMINLDHQINHISSGHSTSLSVHQSIYHLHLCIRQRPHHSIPFCHHSSPYHHRSISYHHHSISYHHRSIPSCYHEMHSNFPSCHGTQSWKHRQCSSF